MELTPEVFEAAGIQRPIPEYRFHEIRKWRFDFAWPYQKLAVEIEGGIWGGRRGRGRHVRGKGYLADMEKYRMAEMMGWHVLRYATQEWATCIRDLQSFSILRCACGNISGVCWGKM